MSLKQIIGVLILTLFGLESCAHQDAKPPVAKKIPKELTIHGDTRIDDYYWLKERENQDVVDYLNAENEYTKNAMKHTDEFQEKLYQEMIGRIKQTDESVPYLSNGYYYYTRYEEGKEYPIYCRKKGSMESSEEILLNVNDMANGYSYYQVRSLSVSEDNKMLSFGLDTVSRRKYTIHFKNLETNEILAESIPLTTGSSTWANDNKTIFYTVKDPVTLRSNKIMRHTLGTDSKEDVLVFEEKDEEFGTYVYKSKSKKYIFVGSYMTESSEIQYLDANNPTGKLTILEPRSDKHEYSVDHYGNHFYITTNWNAKNYRLMKTSVKRTSRKNWKELIAHREDVYLNGIEIFKNFLVIQERKNGLLQIRITSWDKKTDYYMDFGEPAYSAYTFGNRDFDTKKLRYYYSSLTTPGTTYDFDMNTKEKELKKRLEVVGGYNPDEYKTERIYAKAKDGTKVPISLVYKKALKKESNPLLLYAYGSYGSSRDASFNTTRLSLLDRGFIYAIAHIRGGQEMGRDWYEQGRLLNKINTFTDFIDCAEYLIDTKYTDSSRIFAYGGSAGGLLMGAIMNMKGTLFKGVVAAVPFVDVVTTMLDETIPLTTGEYREWGNPNDKEYYEYMKSYSPYDNVEKKEYPATLITTGFHDSQVQYWEPAKWIAKLRAHKTDNNLLIMDCDMETGHGGTTGRFKRYKDTALTYAFLLDQAKITE